VKQIIRLLVGPTLCVFILFSGVVSVAFAAADVTCRLRDCLRDGWTLRADNGTWTETVCLGRNCEAYGWEVRGPRGPISRAECFAGGCFATGWREFVIGRAGSQAYYCGIDPTAPAHSPSVVSDCWSFGWSAQGPFITDMTSCLDGSCRTGGWVSRVVGRPRALIATCKSGQDPKGQFAKDCFRYGWNLYFEN
jgi:hypothetical protein